MDLRILVLDADQSHCELIQTSLEAAGWCVSWCTHADDGLEIVREQPIDAVVTDLVLADSDGLSVCKRLVESFPNLPVIVAAALGDMAAAVAAMRAGARDFLAKPFSVYDLRAVIERSVRDSYRREAVRRLEQSRAVASPIRDLVGQSRQMAKLRDLVQRVAPADTTVLLSGESGTGKELVARALHEQGPRAAGPFVALNCAAVPANLLESELFGHVRGSFTDASGNRKGLFEQAHGGTLFLDEIAEMPLELQPKLLRVLQERSVRPIGSNVQVDVNVRILAATHRDLEVQVCDRRFREDLYYRLNVVQIHIPPLRARGNDISLLAQHFIEKFAAKMCKTVTGISPDACRKLLDYDWPGNVRQLENSMERAVALARHEQISVDDLPDRVRHHDPALNRADLPADTVTTLQHQELQHIQRVLRLTKGNKTEAARLLGVNRRTLYRRLVRESHSLA